MESSSLSSQDSSPLSTPGHTPSPPPDMGIYSTSSVNSQSEAILAQSGSHRAWLLSVQDEAHRVISPISPQDTFTTLSHDPSTDMVTSSPLSTPPTSPSHELPTPPNHYLQPPIDLLPALEQPTTTQLAKTEVNESGSTLAIDEKMPDASGVEGAEVQDNVMAEPALTANSVMAEPAVHAAQADVQLQSEAEKEDLTDASGTLAADNEQQATLPPRPTPTLIELISEAVKKDKKSVKRGDVAILVSLKDMRGTLFASSRKLFAASEVLEKAAQRPTGVRADDPIQYVFLLEIQGDAGAMATLAPLDGSRSLESFSGTNYRPYLDETVKTEPGEPAVPQPLDFKAFTTFLALVAGMPADTKGLFTEDAAGELLHLEAVIAIATPLAAEATLANAFPRLALFWMHHNLDAVIAKQAASWLQIGFILRQLNIYHEAFRHVAGAYPNWPWDKKHDELPDDVLDAIKQRSKSVREFRKDIDLRLSTLSVQMGPRFVTSRQEPNEYHTSHVFQDWITSHLILLDQIEMGTSADEGAIHPTSCPALCGHSRDCLTVAGFYRIISKGGDAYLSADQLVAGNGLLSKASLPVSGWDEGKVRKRLSQLKERAAQIVAPMLTSNSSFKEKETLGYLTCVEPPEGVPWDDGEEADGMEGLE